LADPIAPAPGLDPREQTQPVRQDATVGAPHPTPSPAASASNQVAPNDTVTVALPSAESDAIKKAAAGDRTTVLRSFGEYELLQEIDRGGMGIVFKARQKKLDRIVALKMILNGKLASADEVERFYAEAQAAAQLQHPGIVQVIEVGARATQHYYSMAYVEGKTLAARVAKGPLAAREAGRLVRLVAEAVDYAHQKGIVHRDLKPSNVLVDREGQPKVTDFGLAKRLRSDSNRTIAGTVIGTPSYMSPEQAAGKSDKVGPLADVYSLGALLYCLVTGRPPFNAASQAETMRQVLEREPVSPRQLNAAVDRDLETICLKCLQKEPAKRYHSAWALAEDLGHWLAQEPITARPVGRMERLVRWCRRNPALALSSASALLFLIVGIAGILYFGIEARSAARSAIAHQLLSDQERYDSEIKLAYEEWKEGLVTPMLNRLEKLKPQAPGDPDLRNFEWYYLQNLAHLDLRTFQGHTGPVRSVAYSPDGRWIASAGDDGIIRIWNAASGDVSQIPVKSGVIRSVAFSPDGGCLASAGGDNSVKLWNAKTGALLWTGSGHTGTARAVAFSPDGTRLVSGSEDRTLKIWEIGTGKCLRTLEGHVGGVSSVAFSPNGRWLASGGLAALDRQEKWLPAEVKVWEVSSGTEIRTLKGQPDGVWSVALSPDSSRLAAAGPDHSVNVWNVITGQLVATMRGHASNVLCVTFSSDSEASRLASSDDQGTIRVWDSTTGKELLLLGGHTGPVKGLAFSPDGWRLASGGYDSSVKLWDAKLGQDAISLRGSKKALAEVALSRDALLVASATPNGMVNIWDALTWKKHYTLSSDDKAPISKITFAPDGRRLAAVSDERRLIRIWDLATREEILGPFDCQERIWTLALSPDGRWLATAGEQNTVKLWDLATQGYSRTLQGTEQVIHSLIFDPNSRLLAGASESKDVILWNVASGQVSQTLQGHCQGVWALDFSSNGRYLASGSADRTVRIWDLSAGGPPLRLEETEEVCGVTFSSDDTRLVTARGSRHGSTLTIWDVTAQREILSLPRRPGKTQYLTFNSDLGRLACTIFGVGFGENAVVVWDARPPDGDALVLREARSFVHHLFATPLLRDAVLRRIDKEGTITQAVRLQARALAEHFPEDVERLHQGSRALVVQPGLRPEEYQRALRWAQAACCQACADPGHLSTLGMAHYRAGHYYLAIKRLTQAAQLTETKFLDFPPASHDPYVLRGPYPADLAFLAMAHYQVGDEEQARTALVRLRTLASRSPWASAKEAQALLREASATLSHPR
jgi:WD40 repeat protein/tRNA A-37 threonylcarbamoyl transferase component Bud32